LLVLDIDHFKAINDAHGHLAGDRMLQAIAASLARCVRPLDTVARVGGEEFAVLLPNCRPLFGQAVAERIRVSIAALSVTVSPILTIQATVSIGGAYAPEWVRSTADLWSERADQQLYRAKSGGRNRVCIDEPRQLSVSAEEKGLLFACLNEVPAADDASSAT
jgi:diguanylate cyclase